MDGLRGYPEYRESGVAWLGRVPMHWEVWRNGRLFTHRNETGFADLPILEVSLRTGVRVRELTATGRKQVIADRGMYKRAIAGDITYNMMRMWQGALGLAPCDGLVSPAYVVARPHADTSASYYAHLFRTPDYLREIDTYSRGIVADRNRLYWESFKQIASPWPPLAEQDAIVRYLDAADRRIRRYVRAKQRLIALLEEQKRLILHRAVTRGLDPDVAIVKADCFRFRIHRTDAVGGFIAHQLTTTATDAAAILSAGATRARVNLLTTANRAVALPPLLEQAAIVRYIGDTTAELDTAIAKEVTSIALLREYRTRLIADVVTGKLDVRAAAARLPNEEDEAKDTGALLLEDIDTLDADAPEHVADLEPAEA